MNTDTTIYIPTYRRVFDQFTWRWLSPEWRERTFLVADEEDAFQLDLLGYPVLTCPVPGIGDTRQWIIDQHEELSGRIIMMDDDLKFYRRRTDDPGKFTQMPESDKDGGAEFNQMMDTFTEMLSHVALGGISNRSGANRETAPYRLNGRIHDILGLDLDVLGREGIRINRVKFMEDFDITLQLLTRGYPTLMFNSYCKGDRGSNYKGGCSEYRDAEGQSAAARWMAETWPDYASIVKRPGWAGMEDRIDVQIQWLKAWRAGQRYRDEHGLEQEPSFDWSSGRLEVLESLI